MIVQTIGVKLQLPLGCMYCNVILKLYAFILSNLTLKMQLN
jgi:hypothetical protein